MDRQLSEPGPLDYPIEKIRDSANQFAGHAREGLERGKQAVVDLEHAMIARLQEKPGMILGAALALLGLWVALRLYRRQHMRQFHDW